MVFGFGSFLVLRGRSGRTMKAISFDPVAAASLGIDVRRYRHYALLYASALAGPKYLLLDEPSLGLAPIIVAGIFDQVRQLAERGIGILVVEQDATVALGAASLGYLLENGTIADSGPDLLGRPELTERYFGVRGVVRGDGAPAMAAVLGPVLGAG